MPRDLTDHSAQIEEAALASDHFMGVIRDPDGMIKGFAESSDGGKAASADRREGDGLIDFSFTGTPPQNEADSIRACRIMITALNLRGGEWAAPQEGRGDEVDCESTDPEGRSLRIQVVRALSERKFWRDVAIQGHVERIRVPPAALAEKLREAIELKTAKRPIPPGQRPELVLALDARRTPAMAFDEVIHEFRVRFGEWATAQGFASIWLVGPTPQLTLRLDNSSEA